VLWLFWELRDHLGEAREWVGQLTPAAASLDHQARAELLWTAVATANEVHDDTAALAASRRLAPLLGGIEDPYLQAMCQVVIAWTSPITGDLDGALRQALGSLAALRAQDETYWTAVAALSSGYLEITAGHLDDALRHAEEARDLAGRFGYNWLAAWSRVELGTVNVMRGRLDQARELLDDAVRATVTQEIVEGDKSVVLFETSLRGHRAHGLNVVKYQPSGLVTELTVFFRPLAAMQLVADVIGGHMAQRSGTPPPEGMR